MKPCGFLSIGVVLAILFEFAAKMIRGHLTDIAGKKADLIISSALFRRVMALRLADRPACPAHTPTTCANLNPYANS